jgi:hypothetical protein
MRRIALLLLIASVPITGCTHVQLRRGAVNQADTLADVHQQQVLDNLARFVVNYNAYPSFAFPNQANAGVNDTGSTQLTPGWGRAATPGTFWLNAIGLQFLGQRQVQEAFVLSPINDPRKLELMRCAYQRAVSSAGFGPESQNCPDCEASFNKFYTGDTNGKISDKAQGKITSDCLANQPPWFCVGRRRDVPRCCRYTGHCGDVYIWVGAEGVDQLTKLTIMILDFATNPTPTGLNKTVTYYIDEHGIPTTQKLSVGQVSASVGIDELPASLLSVDQATEVDIEKQLKVQLAEVENRIKVVNGQQGLEPIGKDSPRAQEYKDLLERQAILKNKIDYLDEQLKTPELKKRFTTTPQGTLEFGPSLFQLRNQLQQVTPGPTL